MVNSFYSDTIIN